MLELGLNRSMPADLKDREAEFKEMDRARFRDQAGTIYAALLAAGREKDAEAIVGEAVKLDDSARMRMALAEMALTAGQAREALAKLVAGVDENAEGLAGLRERLGKTLQEKNR